MYNVGFGDAFLLTYRSGDRNFRVLFDCGTIEAPPGRRISQVASRIIADATEPGAEPRVDVVVATHRHKDHVSGFEAAAWANVQVGEVWMPWTEHPTDPAAREIREIQSRLALALETRLTARSDEGLRLLVQNALTNERAMRTLHSGFSGVKERRFLPSQDGSDRTFTTDALPGVTVHVLGPSRDRDVIRDMTPPPAEAYLRLRAAPVDPVTGAQRAPFQGRFETGAPPRGTSFGDAERTRIRDAAALADLDAAVALDQSVNGTSLMLVLDIAGTRLLFPGDAQWGTWTAAMKDAEWSALLRTVRFYKVGHHGSENATPRHFVERLLPRESWAMISTLVRDQWPNVPKGELVKALSRGAQALVARSDRPSEAPAHGYAVESDVVIEAEVPLR